MIEDEEIIRLYKTPGHPIAFSAPYTIYKFFKGEVSLKRIKEILEHINAYTLHREYKQPKNYNPYYVNYRRHQFQADLIDVSQLKRSNGNVTFLLIIIDVFSRKIWVTPLKRKTASETSEALRGWITSLGEDFTTGRRFLTDSGKEFLNRDVENLMHTNNISMYQAKNIHKAAIVERVNKTLQVLIYKYLTYKGETKYIDVLSDLVRGYNQRKHRAFHYRFSPNEADDKANEIQIRSIHVNTAGKKLMKKKTTNTFKVGDYVRIKTFATAPSSSRRAYVQQFHGEIFEVTRVKTSLPITMYYLRSLNTEENIEGAFYANELVHVRGDIFQIEKILRTKGSGSNKKLFVRWKYFDSRWDSWIKASDLIEE